jgi:hypothetical protein
MIKLCLVLPRLALSGPSLVRLFLSCFCLVLVVGSELSRHFVDGPGLCHLFIHLPMFYIDCHLSGTACLPSFVCCAGWRCELKLNISIRKGIRPRLLRSLCYLFVSGLAYSLSGVIRYQTISVNDPNTVLNSYSRSVLL